MPNKEIEIKFSPWDKVVIWNEIKQKIIADLQGKKVSPERSTEIRVFVQQNISKVDSPQRAKEFYEYLGQTYPELAKIKMKLELKEEEKVEDYLDEIASKIIESGDFETGEKMIQEINELQGQGLDSSDILDALQKKYPEFFA